MVYEILWVIGKGKSGGGGGEWIGPMPLTLKETMSQLWSDIITLPLIIIQQVSVCSCYESEMLLPNWCVFATITLGHL